MSNRNQFSYSAHPLYGNVIRTQDDFSTVERQASLLNPPLFPPDSETTFIKRHWKDIKFIIEFLDVYRQRPQVNVEAMRELYHCLEKMTEMSSIRISQDLPIPDHACQALTELGSSGRSGIELGASQYHEPCSVNTDKPCPADVLHVVGSSMYSSATAHVQHQAWASSHNVETKLLRREHETLPWQEVMNEYEKRTAPSPPVYASYPQVGATSAYSCASEVDLDGSLCMTQLPMSPTVFIDTVEAGKGSMVGSPRGEPTVFLFISGGIKRYRCGCGFESDSKGRMDRHHESLRHSERKYGCACGKLFTRVDSLKRHRKRCIRRR